MIRRRFSAEAFLFSTEASYGGMGVARCPRSRWPEEYWARSRGAGNKTEHWTATASPTFSVHKPRVLRPPQHLNHTSNTTHWTNGWECLWRGHSVNENRPLLSLSLSITSMAGVLQQKALRTPAPLPERFPPSPKRLRGRLDAGIRHAARVSGIVKMRDAFPVA